MIGRALVLALVVPACVIEDADVLTAGPVLTDCMAVVGRGNPGQACGFPDVCTWPTPDDPACCQMIAVCETGSLVIERYCAPGCTTCAADRECAFGVAVCDGQSCAACPSPDACPPCAAGTAPVQRNGCATCTCAPPSECGAPDQPMGCPTDEQCYPGLVCADGCLPGDPSCCANVCAAPGCPAPAPLGCDTPCPPALGCATCVTSDCSCSGGAWTCTAICAERTGRCFQP